MTVTRTSSGPACSRTSPSPTAPAAWPTCPTTPGSRQTCRADRAEGAIPRTGKGLMTADLVIRGGTVLDGSGAPGRRADVAVTGDRITAVGDGLDGKRILDAGGHVVAPG